MHHDAQLTAFMAANPLGYVLYIIKVSTDYTKEACNADGQYVPYILPTEFALADLLFL